MGGSGLIGFLQILKGLGLRKAWDYEQFTGLARPPPIRGHAKRYRHADGQYFGLGSVAVTVWQPITKRHSIAFC